MPRRRPPVASDKRFRRDPVRADHGTPERWQHAGRLLELTEQAGLLAARVTEEHVLDSLVLRGLLDERQREAGLKLRRDYQRAALDIPVTAKYSPVAIRAEGARLERERNDVEEAAYRHWRQALKDLGMILSRPVLTTVCHDEWPQAGDSRLLQQGLEKLAGIYKIEKPKPARR